MDGKVRLPGGASRSKRNRRRPHHDGVSSSPTIQGETLLSRVLRLAIAAALLYAGLAGMGQAGLAQVSPAAASAGGASASEKHPKFEVVSIKRHTAESGPVQTGPTPDGFRSIGLPWSAFFSGRMRFRTSLGCCVETRLREIRAG